jgi:hypothetical protein
MNGGGHASAGGREGRIAEVHRLSRDGLSQREIARVAGAGCTGFRDDPLNDRGAVEASAKVVAAWDSWIVAGGEQDDDAFLDVADAVRALRAHVGGQ